MPSHSTTRMRRQRAAGVNLRFWVALVLAFSAALAAWTVLTRDTGWPARARAARRRAVEAENAADYALARSCYEEALVNQPYDWETHLRLAKLLNYRLAARADALRHYLHVLAYAADPATIAETEAEVGILRLLRAGGLEDPADAVEDMFTASETGAEGIFLRRLGTGAPRSGTREYWRAWRARGRGAVGFNRVTPDGSGAYEAQIELNFPGGETVPLRLRCRLRNIWQVNAIL